MDTFVFCLCSSPLVATMVFMVVDHWQTERKWRRIDAIQDAQMAKAFKDLDEVLKRLSKNSEKPQ